MPSSTICDDVIDDIEDLIGEGDLVALERSAGRSNSVIKHVKRKRNIGVKKISEDEIAASENGSTIPGTQKIWIKTWGCAHNSSDSEYMAGQLAAYGYTLTETKNEADLWLLNSCTVKTPAEDHFKNEIDEAQERGKSIVVAGCVPQGQPKSGFLQGLSIIGVQQIDRVVEVVEETLKGHSVRLLGTKKEDGKKIGGASLLLPKIRKNPLVEIISINTGCLNQCTYCKTKHARGELGSYPPEEIIARAEQSFQEGVCEIWLTSEDTGAYGRDIGTSLPELLRKLVEVIPDGCMLRLGMTNPPYILEHLEAIAEILNHPRVYAFLHVPIQSASDAVLGDMKREYCAADFENVVNFLRQRVAGISIATDIICGFPTETESDFEETMNLCSKYKFPSLFINQYFPRPGTPAARLERLNAQVVKVRTKRLTELFKSYQPYDDYVGKTQRVLITDISHDKNYYVGHNKEYVQVLVPMEPDFMGKMVDVVITSSSKFSLMSQPITEPVRPDVPEALLKGQVSGLPSTSAALPELQFPWWSFLALSSVVCLRLGWILYQRR